MIKAFRTYLSNCHNAVIDILEYEHPCLATCMIASVLTFAATVVALILLWSRA